MIKISEETKKILKQLGVFDDSINCIIKRLLDCYDSSEEYRGCYKKLQKEEFNIN